MKQLLFIILLASKSLLWAQTINVNQIVKSQSMTAASFTEYWMVNGLKLHNSPSGPENSIKLITPLSSNTSFEAVGYIGPSPASVFYETTSYSQSQSFMSQLSANGFVLIGKFMKQNDQGFTIVHVYKKEDLGLLVFSDSTYLYFFLPTSEQYFKDHAAQVE